MLSFSSNRRINLPALIKSIVAVCLLTVPNLVLSNSSINELSLLYPADSNAGDEFGISVSNTQNQLVIGAYREDANGSNAGAAYVFEKNSSNNWVQSTKIVGSDTSSSDGFGFSVSVDSNRVLVGAFLADTAGKANTGAAYIFEKNQSNVWVQTAKLSPSQLASNDQFGISVSLSGNRALVGAHAGSGPGTGAAYLYELNAGQWSQVQKLEASDGTVGDQFGVAVSLDGLRAAVGARAALGGSSNATSNAGAAYVYDYNAALNSWQETDKLGGSLAMSSDHFGRALSLKGNTLAVGAYGDRVGASVPNNSGSVYVFDFANSLWSESARILPNTSEVNARFGRTLGLSGNKITVGAYLRDLSGTDHGSAFLFEKNAQGAWTQTHEFQSSLSEAGDFYGVSVSIDDDLILVGANRDDGITDTQTYAGAAYIYEIDPSNLAPIAQASNDQTVLLGQSVTLDGSTSSDSDGFINSFQWTDANSTVLGNSETLIFTPTTTGSFTLTLTVTDNQGASDTDTVVISVNPNNTMCPAQIPIGDLGRGIAARDDATGTGWLMWSNQSVQSRFSPAPVSDAAQHFVLVQFINNQWMYDSNTQLIPFTPSSDDCLIAELDLDNDTIQTFSNNFPIINGIESGVPDTAITITANQWNGVPNAGEYGLSVTPTVITSCPAQMPVGDLGKGVAARDTATGAGWLMWSSETVQSRFSPSPPSDAAKQFIVVQYINDQWVYDSNTTLVAFTPENDDCLVASVNLTNDTVQLFNNASPRVNGIDSGEPDPALIITANQWDGVFNAGEFGLSVTPTIATSCPAQMPIGNLGKGVAARDNATGAGWLMWSSETVQSRFSPSPLSDGAKQFVVVQYVNNQWMYDSNTALVPFTPENDDCLIASVNLSNDTVQLFNNASPRVNGIDSGEPDPELIVTANQWDGVFNAGEFGLSESSPSLSSCPAQLPLGDLGLGIAARDDATGTGWLMWSSQSVQSRFSPSPHSDGAEQFIVVQYVNDQWMYDSNTNLVAFTPNSNDCLIAEINLTSDTVQPLDNNSPDIHGLDAGFPSTPITIIANQWNGLFNAGEFEIVD